MKEIAVSKHFQALERLEKDQPKIVSKGTLINNDSVAVEAGAKKGSIRKARAGHQVLITEIQAASDRKRLPPPGTQAVSKGRERSLEEKLEHCLKELAACQQQRDEAIAREISLIAELRDAQNQIVQMSSGKVKSIHAKIRTDAPS